MAEAKLSELWSFKLCQTNIEPELGAFMDYCPPFSASCTGSLLIGLGVYTIPDLTEH